MKIHSGYKLGYDYRTIPPMLGMVKYLYAESKANNFKSEFVFAFQLFDEGKPVAGSGTPLSNKPLVTPPTISPNFDKSTSFVVKHDIINLETLTLLKAWKLK